MLRRPQGLAKIAWSRLNHAPSFPPLWVLLVVCFSNSTALAVTTEARSVVRISVSSTSPTRLLVEGVSAKGSQTWSFPKTYGGLIGLGERIDGLALTDAENKPIDVRRLVPGEYRAEAAATRFRYEVNLAPPGRSEDSAHISWLTSERGLIMVGDVLPLSLTEKSQAAGVVQLTIDLPASWLISSAEKPLSNTEFEIVDAERAVFLVGKDLRRLTSSVRGVEFTVVTTGQWAFTSQELQALAQTILESHASSLGGMPGKTALLMLSPFPRPEGAQRWSAETRGATVVLLSGLQPSKTAALVQLGVPLTHELFHLWVPNGLALEGDYGWFYEGFTIYQALIAGQRLNNLSFQDFLTSVARAFDVYAAVPDRDRFSLIEASQRRWTTSASLVYQKAMLVAVLYDLTLRSKSGGKRSLDDVYKDILRKHRIGLKPGQGNDAVITAMTSFPGMEDFAKEYVQTPRSIDLAGSLAPFGLRVERFGLRTRITVAESLSRAQRDLLRRLGYNGETKPGHR
jgi:predicted metalloprotease with PDZ domain